MLLNAYVLDCTWVESPKSGNELNIRRFRNKNRKVSGAEGIKPLSLDTSLAAKPRRMEILTARVEGATQ
jgi:hypothetical protein